jgi:hypothetical protein
MRFAKQFIYGTFYVVIWALVIFAVRGFFFHSAVSCFDGKLDQGEQGVDCGGPCATACTAGVQPVAVLNTYTLASTPGHTTFLAKVANLNAALAAEYFAFSFDLRDASGTIVQSFPGGSFLYPNEVKYVALVNQTVAGGSDHPTAAWTLTIATATTQWVASSSFGASPNIAVQNIVTQLGSSTALATGQLTDYDTSPFQSIFIIAVFKDAVGNPIGASQTELDNIAPNQTENFSVSYPAIPNINPSLTEVQAYAVRSF